MAKKQRSFKKQHFYRRNHYFLLGISLLLSGLSGFLIANLTSYSYTYNKNIARISGNFEKTFDTLPSTLQRIKESSLVLSQSELNTFVDKIDDYEGKNDKNSLRNNLNVIQKVKQQVETSPGIYTSLDSLRNLLVQAKSQDVEKDLVLLMLFLVKENTLNLDFEGKVVIKKDNFERSYLLRDLLRVLNASLNADYSKTLEDILLGRQEIPQLSGQSGLNSVENLTKEQELKELENESRAWNKLEEELATWNISVRS